MPPQRRVFVSDCEGPISKNDNAFEISAHFLPRGDYFFALISKYDDLLADVVKRPGYKAGYTLKLITPFLKAYGVTNSKVKEYSAANLILMYRARAMLQQIKDAMPSFIVSTSYEQYISSLCTVIGFPYENVYCTKLDLDKYSVDEIEVGMLKQFTQEISTLPMIEIPKNAETVEQLSKKSRNTVEILDEIFWERIPKMAIGRMIKEVKPIGGGEKADSLQDIAHKLDCSLSDVMYVGDSITDVQAFQLVRRSGGLTVSFNGNEYAIQNADVAVLSKDAMITAVLADVFHRHGRNTVLELVDEWSHLSLERYCSNKILTQMVSDMHPIVLPFVTRVTEAKMDKLATESRSFRRRVRGEAIGRLG